MNGECGKRECGGGGEGGREEGREGGRGTEKWKVI